MPLDAPSELENFHRFVADQLGAGKAALSPEEALDLWRDRQPMGDEFASTAAALKEALSEMDQGDRGQVLDEFVRIFREKHQDPRGE